jgi:hypothetical protein
VFLSYVTYFHLQKLSPRCILRVFTILLISDICFKFTPYSHLKLLLAEGFVLYHMVIPQQHCPVRQPYSPLVSPLFIQTLKKKGGKRSKLRQMKEVSRPNCSRWSLLLASVCASNTQFPKIRFLISVRLFSFLSYDKLSTLYIYFNICFEHRKFRVPLEGNAHRVASLPCPFRMALSIFVRAGDTLCCSLLT